MEPSLGSNASVFRKLMQSYDSRADIAQSNYETPTTIVLSDPATQDNYFRSFDSLGSCSISISNLIRSNDIDNVPDELHVQSSTDSNHFIHASLFQEYQDQLAPAQYTEHTTPVTEGLSENDQDSAYHETSESDSEYAVSITEKPKVGRSRTNTRKKHRRERKFYEPERKTPIEYTDKDVICQRGGLANHHPGNHRYLEAKTLFQDEYKAASKREKTRISQQLVDYVKDWGGRFVTRDEVKGLWYVVHNVTARTKAAQALREDFSEEERAAKRAKYSKKKRRTTR